MAGTAPYWDNTRWGGPDGLRVPQEAGMADLAVNLLQTVAFGAMAADTAITLTDQQCQASYLIATGSGLHTASMTLPAAFPGKIYAVYNNTASNLVLLVTGQTGITVATGKRAILVCNATDVVRLTADT